MPRLFRDTANTNQVERWFLEEKETGVPAENLSVQRREQTQPTYDAGSENRTRANLVGGECSHGSFGEISCKIVHFLYQMFIPASIFIVMLVSIDRFFAVMYPMKLWVLPKTKMRCFCHMDLFGVIRYSFHHLVWDQRTRRHLRLLTLFSSPQ